MTKATKGRVQKHFLGETPKGKYVAVEFVLADKTTAIWFGSLNSHVGQGKTKSAFDVTCETLANLGFIGESIQELNSTELKLDGLPIDLEVEADEKGRQKVTRITTGNEVRPTIDTSNEDNLWKIKLAEIKAKKVSF